MKVIQWSEDSSATSFAPIQSLPLSCKKLCTCKEERFGCTTFQSLWIHYIKLLSSCWLPVAARSPLLCLGPSVALNYGWSSVLEPHLPSTSSEFCEQYVVPMSNEEALLIEWHKRRKLLVSFKLHVIWILLMFTSPALPSGSHRTGSCVSVLSNFCPKITYILQPYINWGYHWYVVCTEQHY